MSWGAYGDMKLKEKEQREAFLINAKEGDKDWDTECEVCEGKPTVHPTGLCGPCCFGEAATINGNW